MAVFSARKVVWHGHEALVATKYLEHNARLGECRVGRDFAAKIERELMENGRVLPPEEIFMNRDHPIGPGSLSMSSEDFYVLRVGNHPWPRGCVRLSRPVAHVGGDRVRTARGTRQEEGGREGHVEVHAFRMQQSLPEGGVRTRCAVITWDRRSFTRR